MQYWKCSALCPLKPGICVFWRSEWPWQSGTCSASYQLRGFWTYWWFLKIECLACFGSSTDDQNFRPCFSILIYAFSFQMHSSSSLSNSPGSGRGSVFPEETQRRSHVCWGRVHWRKRHYLLAKLGFKHKIIRSWMLLKLHFCEKELDL